MNGLEIVLLNVVVFGFLGFTTTGIVKYITHYRLRRRMIDAGLIGEKAVELLRENSRDGYYSSLKWGLIFFFEGIAFVAIYGFDPYFESIMSLGFIVIAASLGFLTYFAFMRREINRNTTE